MKNRISRRLFATIITVVLGISALILLANSLLLKPMYYSSIKSTMLRAMETLSGIDYSDENTLAEKIKEQTAGSAYDVVVREGEDVLYSDSKEFGLMPQPEGGAADGSGVTSTDSADDNNAAGSEEAPVTSETTAEPNYGFQNAPEMGSRFLFDNPAYGSQEWEQVDENTAMGIATEPKTNIEMLICTRELKSGVTIILMQAIEPVNQSIRQANILLIACAAITLGLSVIIVFKLSRRFTEPIRQIKGKVGQIAALQFGEPCTIKTGDELESLASDVNFLGEKLKSTLETLRLQNAQLEKDIIAQRQFISNASHELRTPLSLIKGYADEMTAGYAGDPNQKELYISIIAEEAAKMNRLLKEMLELSRMESGRVTLQNEALCVRDSIQVFLEKYDGYIAENRLTVQLQCDRDLCGIFDPMCFEQVLANYISNAARYGDENKQITISAQDRGDSIRVCVYNTGKPIQEDILPHIWDGFYKADNARTRVVDSYGLGLSIVKAIQTAAGQQYGARNAPGGMEFWFDVRRADPQSAW